MTPGALIIAGVMVSQVAQAHPPTAEEVVKRLDTDGDQQVSRDEFQLPKRDRRPMRMDSDKDGNVSLAEIQERMNDRVERAESRGREIDPERISERSQKLEERFAKQDLNGDGMISKEERRMSAFNHMDSDQDGYLSVAEMEQVKSNRQSRKQRRHDQQHMKREHSNKRGWR